MKEISLHLLDIVQNSVTAGAERIDIDVAESLSKNTCSFTVTDNGSGMASDFLARVTDPFTTTRTTRKVGMGIPLFKLAAEMTGGSFQITSEQGLGTRVRAEFIPSHIDMPPVGNLCETLVVLIQGNPEIDFTFTHRTDKGEYTFRTGDARDLLGGIPLNTSEVLSWIREYIAEQESNIG